MFPALSGGERLCRHMAADRVGSLEVGKDADIVLTDGCPFEVATVVQKVFIDGKEVFSI